MNLPFDNYDDDDEDLPLYEKQQLDDIDNFNKEVLEYPKFDYTENRNEELECPVCMEYYKDPIQHTECGNLFCKECIKNDVCPICRNTIEHYCNAPKIILNMLRNIQVKCLTPNCRKVMKKSELESHWNNICSIKCILCDNNVSINFIKEHIENLCPNVDISCEFCFDSYKRKNIDEHIIVNCPKVSLTCEYCSEYILREVIEKHVIEECPKIERNCKGFDFGCVFKECSINVKEHEVNCPYIVLYPILQKQQDEIKSLNNKLKDITEELQILENKTITEVNILYLDKILEIAKEDGIYNYNIGDVLKIYYWIKKRSNNIKDILFTKKVWIGNGECFHTSISCKGERETTLLEAVSNHCKRICGRCSKCTYGEENNYKKKIRDRVKKNIIFMENKIIIF
jgi:hypothetical protein